MRSPVNSLKLFLGDEEGEGVREEVREARQEARQEAREAGGEDDAMKISE